MTDVTSVELERSKKARQTGSMARLIDDLNALHDRYVEAVNSAVAADDLPRAHRLAAEYDEEAIELIAVHEGRTDQLPIRRPGTADSGLRARIRRLTARPAA
jgi:hypothetical protein